MTEYEVELSCGCVRWYPVWAHPFAGAILSCPEHGMVKQMLTGDSRASDD